MSDILNSEEVSRLSILIEESTRTTSKSPDQFVEPALGTLQRYKSRRSHIVFGRRGSSKTSLLRKVYADVSLERIPATFVDLETFKGHSCPDVLVSVLIETLRGFDKWLEGIAVTSG